MIMSDCSGEFRPQSAIPKHELEALVHTFYPAIIAFFSSEEGRRKYEAWLKQNEKSESEKVGSHQSDEKKTA